MLKGLGDVPRLLRCTVLLGLPAFLMMIKGCCTALMAFLWSAVRFALICGFLACSILSSAELISAVIPCGSAGGSWVRPSFAFF